MLRIRTISTAGALLLSAGSAHALPLADVEIGARYWQADPSGDVAYDGDDFSVEDDLDFDKEGTPNLYARAAIPFVTLDAEYTDLSYDGDIQRSRTWGGETATLDGSSSFDARLLHAGAMFNLPVPIVDVGLGLGATNIDTEAELETDAGKETGSANFTMPVAKAEVRVDLPALPLNAGVRANGIGYDGDSFRDVTAEVGYEMGLLQVRAGYRQIAVDYDGGDDLKVDSDFSGPFAGLHLAF
ncbi:MAG: TIGR04219 family outer membrane beta-barrel protein [Thiohalorhabdus sp.]|uniref:TIGR04219 family outer membrane beta-barrel protein n=1 Tax=Thiohalorhabdus sp. TaxID=3094134 RepID=UPI00397EAF0F